MTDLAGTYLPARAGEYAWTFGGVAPVARVAPGHHPRAVRPRTVSAAGSAPPTTWSPRSSSSRSSTRRPVPFYVEGAEPGDTLAVHFVSIEPSRDWAASSTVPLFGALTVDPRHGRAAGPAARGGVDLASSTGARRPSRSARGSSDITVELPLDPMHGTVGVAPANLEARSSLVPDAHGGNMDTPEMRAGRHLLPGRERRGRPVLPRRRPLPARARARRAGSRSSAAMDTVVIVDVIKGAPSPVAAAESRHAPDVTGSARPLEDAFRISQHDLIQWLVAEFGMERSTRTSCSPRRRVAGGERLRPELHVRVEDPQAVPPGRRVYGGAHARLREMARAYLSERR